MGFATTFDGFNVLPDPTAVSKPASLLLGGLAILSAMKRRRSEQNEAAVLKKDY